jgi:photosystem II stability/assembly factor-like uncharacterized protein
MDEPTDAGKKMIVTVRQFVLAAAVVMLFAGASYARGAPAAESTPYISGIQINPKRPNIVYASTLGPDSVLKSTDAGKTWSAADTGLTNPASPTKSEDLRVDAFALDPRSPSVLYVGTGIGVFKTTNGARTWKLASAGIDLGAGLGSGLAHRLAEGSIWAIAIDPSHTSTVYTGGRGGVWKTTTGGATWKRVLQGRVLNLAVDPRQPETVYASAEASFQSNAAPSTVYKTVDGGRSWRAIGPRFGYPIVVDRRAPGSVYAGGPRGLFASANGGRTWSRVLTLRKAVSRVTAIALDPVRANVLYVGTWGSGVMKSDDGGQTWLAPRLDGRGRRVSAIAIAPTRPQTIYASVQYTGSQGSTAGMFASSDGGATWHRLF